MWDSLDKVEEKHLALVNKLETHEKLLGTQAEEPNSSRQRALRKPLLSSSTTEPDTFNVDALKDEVENLKSDVEHLNQKRINLRYQIDLLTKETTQLEMQESGSLQPFCLVLKSNTTLLVLQYVFGSGGAL